MKTIQRTGVVAGLFALSCGTAWAQQYPAKPVRVVVVFPAGGGTDITARIVFQKVAEQMKQQFVIDNRAGAAGMIGAELVAKSPPDGYTIMVYSQTFINNFHLYQKVAYELKDFAAVAMLVRWVGMLTVHPSMPVRTTKEFIALAKARPGEILYGSAGVGAYQHLSMSVLLSMSGVKATHVPFKGGAPAVVALVGGEVQSILTPIAEVYSHIQPGGRLRPIAVSSEKRTTQFPNIPAIAETVKGYEFTSWFGCLAPAGTPKPVLDRLSAEIKKALAEPEVVSKLAPQVLDPMHMTPEEFTKHLRVEYDKMREIVKQSGARVE